jgi:hypothetical protein
VDLAGLYAVLEDMIHNYGYTPEELCKSYDELIRRGILGQIAYEKTKVYLTEKGVLYDGFKPSMEPLREKTVVDGKVFEMEGAHEPWVMPRIDYLNDYR